MIKQGEVGIYKNVKEKAMNENRLWHSERLGCEKSDTLGEGCQQHRSYWKVYYC